MFCNECGKEVIIKERTNKKVQYDTDTGVPYIMVETFRACPRADFGGGAHYCCFVHEERRDV